MRSITAYILECLSQDSPSSRVLISEGGASGHMKHIIDYDDMTLDDLCHLIYDLFSGRVERVTEKVDGTNIQVSMNDRGEVIFIRNKGDLNSVRGGMSLEDMRTKWRDNARVQEIFVESGKVIERIVRRLGVSFFNPEPDHRLFLNCECIRAGKTNVIPYISSKVYVHDIWAYQRSGTEWVHIDTTRDRLDKVHKTIEGEDDILLTPSILIRSTDDSNRRASKYVDQLKRLWKANSLRSRDTILDLKRVMWSGEMKMLGIPDYDELFDRYVRGIKSGKSGLTNIKKLITPEQLAIVEAKHSAVYKSIMSELSVIVASIGNDIISACSGFLNDSNKDKVVDELTRDLKSTIEQIHNTGDANAQEQLVRQLAQLERVGNKINHIEGIVFMHNGRLMKITGSFALMYPILRQVYSM